MTGDLQILRMARKGAELMLAEIDAEIAQLTGARPAKLPESGKRTMSPEAKARIADAQKKRWEAHRAGKKAPTAIQPNKAAKPGKVAMSVAGKKRIQEANKKRWAEYRAKKAAEEKGKPKTATAGA